MFFVLLGLWFIFNQKFTLEILIIGIIVSALVFLFCYKLLRIVPKKEVKLYRMAIYGFVYVFVLIKEILKANLDVMRIIIHKNASYRPAIIKVKVNLKTRLARMILANSITLTPGTITIDENDGIYTVHCLNKVTAESIEQSDMVKLLHKMEGTK